MSLAVTIGLDVRSRQLELLRGSARLIVLAGCCLTAVALWQGFAGAPPIDTPAAEYHAPWRAAAMVLACFAVCAVLSWRMRAAARYAGGTPGVLDHGWFVIDEAGAVGWRPGPAAGAVSMPLVLHDSYLGRTLISLRFTPSASLGAAPPVAPLLAAARSRFANGRPLHLLLARDAVPADQWRRLRVWVLWRQRGGRDGVVL